MRIEILGRPISKKNSRQLSFRGGKIQNRPSAPYEQYRKDALKQMTIPPGGTLEPPYQATYEFQMKGKIEADLDNLIASLNDIMQEKGIIENDKFIRKIIAEKKGGYTDWKTIVTIISERTLEL